MTNLLEVSGVSKSFGPVKVLKEISFDVRPGEVHALLGENGAGKSTLIKIVAGVINADEGEVLLEGKAVRFSSPREAAAHGIATVYQELLLFPDLTVAENIYLGHAPKTRWGTLDWNAMRAGARRLLDALDSPDLDVDTTVGKLSVANRQRVEIAKALSQDAKLVIMDEPTAALADADARRLMDVVKRLRDRGVGIIYVSHRLPEIFALADRVTVLRDGTYVGTRPIGEVTEADLVSMMVGRAIDHLFPKVDTTPGQTILEVKHLSYRNVVNNISLTVRAGEIVGIAGLVGSGRTELALTIFGITPATSGEILIDGKPVTISSPDDARRLRIAYVPEDRGLQGLIRPQTVRENVSLAILDRIAKAFVVDRSREGSLAKEAIERFGIRTRGPEQRVKQLSGGNQQKVVLAKWIATEPRVLIMDEPTRGIDVGAKAEIHALMSRLAGQGLAVLMISSELPEVLGMSDRVLVMRGGRIVGQFDRKDATPDAVGAAMTAAKAGTSLESAGAAAATAGTPALSRIVPIRRWKSVFESYGQELVILGVIVVLFIGVGLYNPRFVTPNNLTSLFVGNAYIAIAAIGMSLVIISGNIDVSVGSLIGVLGTIAGTMAVSGYPILLCWLVPILLGMAINAGVGVLVAYVKIPSIVVTLGMLSILKGGLISITGGAWISGMPPGFMIAQFRLFGIPSSVYFMVVLTVLAALWMKYSVFGRTIYAIGGNPEAARVSGIRIQPSIVGVFTIHGMFAGIAAVLFATQLQVIQSTVPPNLELTVITASVVGGVSILGGTGTVIGSTLAAILFAAIGSSLVFLNVSAYWLRAVQGLMILATVLADMARRRRI